MTDTLPRGHKESATRRVRGPAHAVMTECLRIQASARRPSRLARLFGRNPILPDARSWYRGALGEIHVAKVLAGLAPGWTVLYAPDAPALLLGPAGAFTIATKNHSRQRVWVGDDQLLVNGRRTHHLRDARDEARRVTRLLGTPVLPVLAIVDPAHLDIKARPEGAEVLAASQLATYLSRRKARLSEDEVASLLASATAGGFSAEVVDETLRHEARFARLVAEVESAARRRWLWAGIATLALAVLLVLAVTLT